MNIANTEEEFSLVLFAKTSKAIVIDGLAKRYLKSQGYHSSIEEIVIFKIQSISLL